MKTLRHPEASPLRRSFVTGAVVLALCLVAPLLQAQRHPLDAAAGKALFERHWIPAPASTAASDGLGPFYNARACSNCHPAGGRGNDLQALTLRSNDAVYGRQLQPLALAGLAPELQYRAAWVPALLQLPDGSREELEALQLEFSALRYGPLQGGWSARLAPALHGLWRLQDVTPATLQALADPDDADGDGISGRVAQLRTADGTLVSGRFGWKAELPDLLTQTAVALSLDIGLASPPYPAAHGDCTPAQTDCLQQVPGTATGPAATEVDAELLQLLLAYLESLPAPASGQDAAGLALFERSGCAACHVPALPAADGPVPAFTDLLLHDMGQGLTDTLATESAAPSEWRTAPLWGLGRAQRLLHDGRAGSMHAAILWHGGEAEAARAAYLALGAAERRQLLDFLEGL